MEFVFIQRISDLITKVSNLEASWFQNQLTQDNEGMGGVIMIVVGNETQIVDLLFNIKVSILPATVVRIQTLINQLNIESEVLYEDHLNSFGDNSHDFDEVGHVISRRQMSKISKKYPKF
ncbi:MAG: hypothetical protein ACJA1A_003025 [Saprospiraceae bacterium]|jgi:hypothetical protein|tara:strand:- start:387 stop:746 length:360 start_codon:yes stop_codon:yes gene_type:complete